MPHTIEQAFEEFLLQLRTTPAETAAAKSHRASIKAKLEEAFRINSFFRTGSFGNGTDVARFSDVDYFAVIPRTILRVDSSLSLSAVAQALRERFPTTSGIRVCGPSVRVPFGLDGAEATEIVPVDETGLTRLGFRQFDMPDGNGGWKFTAPPSHNGYVNQIDDKLDGKLKPLIRLAKAWKFMRNVPLRSFYLEIFTASYAHGESTIIYDVDLCRLFDLLATNGVMDIIDPRFPRDGFVIDACNTDEQCKDVIAKIKQASTWATEALQYRAAGQLAAAFHRWRLIFNHNFPPLTSH